MKRELGIARCGLACCLCSENVTCKGCKRDGFSPLSAEPSDEQHMIFIERSDDEYYVRIDHAMTKEHFISFVAAAGADEIKMVKLYPEGKSEARFKIRGGRKIFFYCNHDGLFSMDVVKGIDDKESGYDDSQERKELEKVADKLFG